MHEPVIRIDKFNIGKIFFFIFVIIILPLITNSCMRDIMKDNFLGNIIKGKESKFISQYISNMDYIILTDSDEIIPLTSVKTIQPAFWKGSKNGILYYKDGSCIEVKVSNYGHFFGIKGEIPMIFSNGYLYEYRSD